MFVIYIPPDTSVYLLDTFIDQFEQFICNYDYCGDFNIRGYSTSLADHKSRIMHGFINFLSLEQYSIVPNFNDCMLDLVLSNNTVTNFIF